MFHLARNALGKQASSNREHQIQAPPCTKIDPATLILRTFLFPTCRRATRGVGNVVRSLSQFPQRVASAWEEAKIGTDG